MDAEGRIASAGLLVLNVPQSFHFLGKRHIDNWDGRVLIDIEDLKVGFVWKLKEELEE